MVDQNGGKFELFQKLSSYPNRKLFSQTFIWRYLESDEKITENFDFTGTLNLSANLTQSQTWNWSPLTLRMSSSFLSCNSGNF